MIDHAPNILAQQQAARENEEMKEMKEMEKRAAPLLWAMFMAVLVLSLGHAVKVTQAHIDHVAELEAQADAFAQCMNGQMFMVENALLRCELRTRPLVAGIGGA